MLEEITVTDPLLATVCSCAWFNVTECVCPEAVDVVYVAPFAGGLERSLSGTQTVCTCPALLLPVDLTPVQLFDPPAPVGELPSEPHPTRGTSTNVVIDPSRNRRRVIFIGFSSCWGPIGSVGSCMSPQLVVEDLSDLPAKPTRQRSSSAWPGGVSFHN